MKSFLETYEIVISTKLHFVDLAFETCNVLNCTEIERSVM